MTTPKTFHSISCQSNRALVWLVQSRELKDRFAKKNMSEDKSQAEYNIRDFPKKKHRYSDSNSDHKLQTQLGQTQAIRNFGQNGVVYFCEFHPWTMGVEALGVSNQER